MSLRTIASFAVAIFLGLVAVILVRAYLGSANRPGGGGVEIAGTPVVVAAVPVERGAELKPGMLKVVTYPAGSVPTGSFRKINDISGKSDETRLALRSLAANEPILNDKLSGPGAKANLAATLTEGMRAVSVRSNDVSGVGGFLLPGDRVDVMLTREIGKADAKTYLTQVLAENVRVLGVDQSDNPEAEKPQVAKAVTIEVTPDQAQAISLAHTVGSVALALRQIADVAPLTRKVTTVNDLGGARRVAVGGPARARPSGPQVRVTRGVEVSGYTVSSGS